MLKIETANKYHDTRYVEHAHGTVAWPNYNRGRWSIKNPSPQAIERYAQYMPTALVENGDHRYIVSRKGQRHMRPVPVGACVITEVTHANGSFFLLVIDAWHSLQNPQGSARPGEEGDLVRTAARELREETTIEQPGDAIRHIGTWSFHKTNPLIQARVPAVQHVFYTKVPLDRLGFLNAARERLLAGHTALVNTRHVDSNFNEIRYLLCVPATLIHQGWSASVDNIPDARRPIVLEGHQHACLEACVGKTPTASTDHLVAFNVPRNTTHYLNQITGEW